MAECVSDSPLQEYFVYQRRDPLLNGSSSHDLSKFYVWALKG